VISTRSASTAHKNRSQPFSYIAIDLGSLILVDDLPRSILSRLPCRPNGSRHGEDAAAVISANTNNKREGYNVSGQFRRTVAGKATDAPLYTTGSKAGN